MKKVLIIEASPRKGHCANVAGHIAGQIQAYYEIELLTLRDLRIGPCKGCAACLYAGSSRCPLRDDDAVRVLEKMLWADGVVFVVPNYALSVPALLKNLFDRLAYIFHRPRLFHRVCVPVIVQGVIGGKKIAVYINDVMGYWGMIPVKGAVVTGDVYPNKSKPAQQEQKDHKAIDAAIERFDRAIRRADTKIPSLLKLMIFRFTRTSIRLSADALPPDKAYFERMGWFESDYYYKTRMNIPWRLAGAMSDKLAGRLAGR